ncbi:MAG: glycosyltransferase family 4 protein [Cyanobacteria bacterium J06639_14]
MNNDKLIVYVAGPIDADHVYECWQNGQEDQSYFGARYLLEFYGACQDLSLKPHVIAPKRKAGYPEHSKYSHIEYWETNNTNYSGAMYHINGCIMMLRIIARAVKLGASAIVITRGRPYWFLMNLANILGIQVIPSVHCVLWPKFKSPSMVYQILFGMTASFFKFGCSAIMVVSDDIAVQIKEVTQNKCRPTIKFFPIYSQHLFEGVDEQQDSNFKVLFVGRVEVNKGVFILLEIARQILHEDNNTDIVFDICGIGSALEELKHKVQELGLEENFRCHGFCEKPKLKEYYVNATVVIVPTTTDFIEGFNKVCAEAILAAKPVITSNVCPAVAEISSAAVVVPQNDTAAYKAAILELYSNQSLYAEKKASTYKVKEKFLESQNGWGEKFKTVILNYTNLVTDQV